VLPQKSLRQSKLSIGLQELNLDCFFPELTSLTLFNSKEINLQEVSAIEICAAFVKQTTKKQPF
jgi:hypothetical protein